METREVAKLTLRTFDILQNNTLSDTDNNIGTISTNGQLLTFKNINFRAVLGSMFDKYNKFNLKLSAFSHRPPTVNLAGNHNCSIFMSGLPFINCTYNHSTGTFKNETCIAVVPLRSGTTGTSLSFIEIQTTLMKPLEIQTITLEFRNSSTQVINGLNEKINQMIGHTTFMFEFVGIDD